MPTEFATRNMKTILFSTLLFLTGNAFCLDTATLFRQEVSSSPAHTSDIASTSYIGLATATITLNGDLSLRVDWCMVIDNDTAGRTYTIAVAIDSVVIVSCVNESPVNSTLTVSPFYYDSTSSSGLTDVSIWVKSSSAVGTQTAKLDYLLVSEYSLSQ